VDLRSELQTTLGAAYTMERELGGGGMSRVFVAREAALNREVVVKVLPPELTGGVNVERFRREIQLAAALQHPHIVQVLSTGETNGIPYYLMPFVQGESLRARLARAGAMPIGEVVSVLRDVAKALAYAHERGVVHRDIKPDNVLLSGGVAVVTDFGVAKALSNARSESGHETLTAIGSSLGTPAYMAPEQAAADPGTNHRADIYAFGVMAFEMLAGRAPFHGRTPQKLLAAQMGERPQPILELRPDTPAVLADLVMRCLEKDPDDRPQSAADLAHVLESVTSSGGADRAMPAILLGGRMRLWRALGLWAAAFVSVVILARASIIAIGLPDWVLPGAVIVMALGLPAILFTAFVHYTTHAALTRTPTLTPGGSRAMQGTLATIAVKASPWVSWRRTILGGAAALGVFVALVATYMVLRAFGIGPAGSLMAAGKLSQREKVILADFKSPATDSLLGPTITEAFRTDVGQSANLTVMPMTSVREVLRRMQKPANTRIDYAVAREIATREGIKAVIDGDVVALGGSYVLSVRLVTAQSGEELAAFRETANDAKDIIPAISRLSKQLRSRVGESLRSVQGARTLDKVTTPSLEAFQKYAAGVKAIEEDGDVAKGEALLEEAITLDTAFAMAYRKLAVSMNNRGGPRPRMFELFQKAYDHRERLSESERYQTVATYYQFGPHRSHAKTTSAYESLLEADPDNITALNNLALEYAYRREFAKAEQLAKHAIELQPTIYVFYSAVALSQVRQSKLSEAEQTLEQASKALPRHPGVVGLRSRLAFARGDIDRAVTITDSVRTARPNDATTNRNSSTALAQFAALRGRLGESAQLRARSRQLALAAGNRQAALNAALDEAEYDLWFRNQKERGLATINRSLVEHPIDSIASVDRPYARLAYLYRLAGRADLVKAAAQQAARQPQPDDSADIEAGRHGTAAEVAMAEGRYADAVKEYRAADVGGSCVACPLPSIAQAYDLAGMVDSAIAVFSRYVDAPERPLPVDFLTLAGSHKRLGELYEAKGDRAKAASHYTKFVALWKDADPELQPQVADVKKRLARLGDTERR
jgi:tetratricopeptide (TPR) repeat protein